MERNEPPRWMQDKHFNEVLFCEDFLSAHPMVCVDGSFFTVEGRVADEEGIRKQIYEMLRPHFTSGTARRATGLLETLRLEAEVKSKIVVMILFSSYSVHTTIKEQN